MSLNIQSLSAKFNELKDTLDVFESKNCLPDIILLQEIWNVPSANLFVLDQYHPLVFKCRSNSNGGGVGIYVKSSHKLFAIVVVSLLSDHFPVIFLKDLYKKHVKLNQSTFRDFSYFNMTHFTNQLSTTDWRGVSLENDLAAAFSNFSNIFGMIHESFFSPKIRRFNKNIHKKKSLDDPGPFNLSH
jgi:hypothetical protein